MLSIKSLLKASLLSLAFLYSCSSEEPIAADPVLEVAIPESSNPIFVTPGTPYQLSFTAENAGSIQVSNLPEGWSAEVDMAGKNISVSATAEATSVAKLTVTAVNDTKSVSQEVSFYCLNSFDNPAGTFVLNEGNMTTENGSLTYITPEGYVIDDAYKAVNGTELGNVAQDMFFLDGKIYIISQNGNENATGTSFENDGMMVILDAKTLKKEKSFTHDDLPALEWPTHIAAIDPQHVYVRDNNGIYRLNSDTKELTLVEGTEGAPKSRFVVMNDKVYTYKQGSLSGLLEISADSDQAKSILFPFRVEISINEVLGIRAADNGKVWVMSFGFGKMAIGKFDPSTKEIIQREITVQPSVGSSGIAFAAKGNEIYYADDLTLYRLKFDENPELDAASGLEAEEQLATLSELDSNAGILYNGLAIHPETGNLYANTIKSFPLFNKNQIWVFDTASDFKNPLAKYENHTHFPAGFYFPNHNN